MIPISISKANTGKLGITTIRSTEIELHLFHFAVLS